MYTFPAPLAEIAALLRSDQLDILSYVDEVCDRIDALEAHIHALVPEPDRRARLQREAAALQARYPDPASRPPLYGVLVGVKDIFHVDGFPTRAGTQVPAELFAGPEASCVTTLRAAGALMLGKTITTEFAYFEPGPTRNPHNLDHTPGGSSSGSAAAVAAGYCPMALGTQTVGSVIRPAAFCGIVGFKPSYGRIPTDGIVPFSVSADHVGIFTQDVAGLTVVAPLVCRDWQACGRDVQSPALPVLGIPEGPYLEQASAEARTAFDRHVEQLIEAGYTVKRVPVLANIAEIARRHGEMIAAEMADVHAAWFASYAALYRPRTVELIRAGQTISAETLMTARAGRMQLRAELEASMTGAGIDMWICPAATGPAPTGIESTGDPAMNLPWTHAGVPVITLPVGVTTQGLPLGLQCVAPFMGDECLVQWAEMLETCW